MHPGDSERRARITAMARQAIAAAKAGEDAVAINIITGFLSGSPQADEEIRELILLLFAECSRMVSALGANGTVPVTMQVFNEDGHEVAIDDADPPVRTAVRALLAEVHGDRGASTAQIEIALANGAPAELAAVVIQALRWTVRLAMECAGREIALSPWISAALDE